MASLLKGIFKENRCPLQLTIVATPPERTRKISTGVLKAIYDSLPNEYRLLTDFQAYAGERISAICSNTPLTNWENHDNKYTLIHIDARQTKARYAHVCIIPKELADQIRAYAQQLDRTVPFPNHETLWRDIRKHASNNYGVRLTSHYLRKRFHTIAGKTAMPVNDWDYLMGDKPSYGHHAGTYTLEDFTELVNEYDRFLAPYLSIGNPKEPDDSKEPFKSTELEQVKKENAELKEQLLKLTKLLTDKLADQKQLTQGA